MQIGTTPAGAIESVPLKRRQVSKYWRPAIDDSGNITEWMETHNLPCDAVNKEKYLAKGFRLTHPSEDNSQEVEKDAKMLALEAEVAKLKEQLKIRTGMKMHRRKK